MPITKKEKQLISTTRVAMFVLIAVVVSSFCFSSAGHGQRQKADKTGSHSTRGLAGMSPAARALVEEATGVVCTEAKLDPRWQHGH
jgi:hypothetical protein